MVLLGDAPRQLRVANAVVVCRCLAKEEVGGADDLDVRAVQTNDRSEEGLIEGGRAVQHRLPRPSSPLLFGALGEIEDLGEGRPVSILVAPREFVEDLLEGSGFALRLASFSEPDAESALRVRAVVAGDVRGTKSHGTSSIA